MNLNWIANLLRTAADKIAPTISDESSGELREEDQDVESLSETVHRIYSLPEILRNVANRVEAIRKKRGLSVEQLELTLYLGKNGFLTRAERVNEFDALLSGKPLKIEGRQYFLPPIRSGPDHPRTGDGQPEHHFVRQRGERRK